MDDYCFIVNQNRDDLQKNAASNAIIVSRNIITWTDQEILQVISHLIDGSLLNGKYMIQRPIMFCFVTCYIQNKRSFPALWKAFKKNDNLIMQWHVIIHLMTLNIGKTFMSMALERLRFLCDNSTQKHRQQVAFYSPNSCFQILLSEIYDKQEITDLTPGQRYANPPHMNWNIWETFFERVLAVFVVFYLQKSHDIFKFSLISNYCNTKMVVWDKNFDDIFEIFNMIDLYPNLRLQQLSHHYGSIEITSSNDKEKKYKDKTETIGMMVKITKNHAKQKMYHLLLSMNLDCVPIIVDFLSLQDLLKIAS